MRPDAVRSPVRVLAMQSRSGRVPHLSHPRRARPGNLPVIESAVGQKDSPSGVHCKRAAGFRGGARPEAKSAALATALCAGVIAPCRGVSYLKRATSFALYTGGSRRFDGGSGCMRDGARRAARCGMGRWEGGGELKGGVQHGEPRTRPSSRHEARSAISRGAGPCRSCGLPRPRLRPPFADRADKGNFASAFGYLLCGFRKNRKL